MGKGANVMRAAADATLDFLYGVADEARERGNHRKLESAERAIAGEVQRKASFDSDVELQRSTFFVGPPEPPCLEREAAALEAAPRAAVLLVCSGEGRPRQFVLGGARTVVGRDPGVEVRLEDVSVSRRHAAIIRSGERYFLRDLESKNGTYFRGLLQGAEQPLRDGDRFRIGHSDFVFRERALTRFGESP